MIFEKKTKEKIKKGTCPAKTKQKKEKKALTILLKL